ncbi:MAG: hypothetical protein M5U26_08465 [Planctomycetota bacterium]|nr:hypothetical protein [Planctomycetota bacterium]
MNFYGGQPVKVKGLDGPCIFEGYGPMTEDCSVLVGLRGARVRKLVKLADVEPEAPAEMDESPEARVPGSEKKAKAKPKR